jgi:hypothetical protein
VIESAGRITQKSIRIYEEDAEVASVGRGAILQVMGDRVIIPEKNFLNERKITGLKWHKRV